MPTTTPRLGLPVPTNDDGPLGGTQIQTFGAAVEKYVNQRYASATARDTAITSPQEGEEVWLQNLNLKQIHNGVSWVSMVPGIKVVAEDTGSGGLNVTAGPVTIHPARTVSDPFGTGVPYLLLIYANTLFDGSSNLAATFHLMSPALGSTIIRGQRVGTGGSASTMVHYKAYPSGGSDSWSTHITDFSSGTATWYADGTNNYIVYFAAPLYQ